MPALPFSRVRCLPAALSVSRISADKMERGGITVALLEEAVLPLCPITNFVALAPVLSAMCRVSLLPAAAVVSMATCGVMAEQAGCGAGGCRAGVWAQLCHVVGSLGLSFPNSFLLIAVLKVCGESLGAPLGRAWALQRAWVLLEQISGTSLSRAADQEPSQALQST